MKRNINVFAATLAVLLVLVGVTSTHAQTRNQRAYIPFSFNAAGKTLPPGEYRISRLNEQTSKELFVIRNNESNEAVVVLTSTLRAKQTPKDSQLVFNCYGDQRYLSQMWIEGDDNGIAMPKSHAERQIEREATAALKKQPGDVAAVKGSAPTTVLVALK
jgi:hypothetical protein